MKCFEIICGALHRLYPNVQGVLCRAKSSFTPSLAAPEYEDPEPIEIQVQSAKSEMLAQKDYLNQQGELKLVYSPVPLFGVDRFLGKGGDILEFMGRRWLVVQRLESWENSHWCKVLVQAQLDPPLEDDAKVDDYVH
ncbi:hypothetical protein [Commensalibacter sp. Nvir]|uniref:hypothetical protein n=1 Tax=Commensalibacter sp. Nvir TaxID=3069817 RepID=UPI0030C7B218